MKNRYIVSVLFLLAPLCLYADSEEMAGKGMPSVKSESSAPQVMTSKQAYKDMTQMFGFVPSFFKAYPEAAIAGAWVEYKGILLNNSTAIPGKYKELIGLAVSAQVPCKYCAYAHENFARLNGATAMQVQEAVAVSSSTRHWSTLINGLQLSDASLRSDVDRMVKSMKNPPKDTTLTAPTSNDPVAWTKYEIQQSFGFVPEFINRMSAEALPGAWQDMKQLNMTNTQIPAKYKDLISLAVSAQIPCAHCTYADTEFAKFDGATDREIAEALSVASLTRKWSTVLNGMQVSDSVFRAEIDRIVKKVQGSMKSKKFAGRR